MEVETQALNPEVANHSPLGSGGTSSQVPSALTQPSAPTPAHADNGTEDGTRQLADGKVQVLTSTAYKRIKDSDDPDLASLGALLPEDFFEERLVPFGQGTKDMSPALDTLGRARQRPDATRRAPGAADVRGQRAGPQGRCRQPEVREAEEFGAHRRDGRVGDGSGHRGEQEGLAR